MATEATTIKSLTERLYSSAAIIDTSDFGRLRVSGDDAIDLLNRLSTNNLELLEPDQGMGTVLTTNKGRIIDLLRVLHRGDELLVLTSPGTQGRVAEWIDFYTFAEDVSVEDVTASTSAYLVVGNPASDVLATAETDVSGLTEQFSHATTSDDTAVIRSDLGQLPAFEIIEPEGAQSGLIGELGLETLDSDDFARLRIEQGVPAYPNEMNEDHNPLEAGLKPHISFNKGCYIGQEVVARLDTYDRVQRFLCQLEIAGGSVVESGSKLVVNGDEVGEVTSSGSGLALGFLRKRHYQDGTTVEVVSNGSNLPAVVRDLRPAEED